VNADAIVWPVPHRPVDAGRRAATPDLAAFRGGLDATAGRRRAALPPGRRVVALREVNGMPHLAIPEICPPGEDMGGTVCNKL